MIEKGGSNNSGRSVETVRSVPPTFVEKEFVAIFSNISRVWQKNPIHTRMKWVGGVLGKRMNEYERGEGSFQSQNSIIIFVNCP